MATVYNNALGLFNVTVKTTPIGADLLPIGDSAVTGTPLKQATIANVIAAGGGASAKSIFAIGYGNSNNDFYLPTSAVPSTGTFSVVASTLYCMPIIIPISTTFTKIGVEITSANAGAACRLGIYDNTGTGGYPGAKVVDAGTVVTTSNGVVLATISQVLQGAYWLVAIQGAGNSTQFRGLGSGIAGSTASVHASHVLGFTGTSTTATAVAGLSEASVSSYFTALPSSLSADTFAVVANASSAASSPLVFLKV